MMIEQTLVLIILGPFLPVLIFYILDRFFNLKIKFIKKFKSTKAYQTSVSIISASAYFLFGLFLFSTDNLVKLNPLLFSIVFLNQYLVRIPKELR